MTEETSALVQIGGEPPPRYIEKFGFPGVIDSSMLASFVSCPRQFFHSYVQRWKTKGTSIHLLAGSAYHKGLETARNAFYFAGESESQAIEAGLVPLIWEYQDPVIPRTGSGKAKTWDNVCRAYLGYFKEWPLHNDPLRPIDFENKGGVEFSFAIPLDILHPDTGDPLVFAGRFDMLAEEQGTKMIMGEDDKTGVITGRWAESWRLRAQFQAYTWAAQQHEFPCEGIVVRGAHMLMTEVKYAETRVRFAPWKLKRWEAWMHFNIKQMITAWKEGYWNQDFGSTCTSYNGCEFTEACSLESPDFYLEQYFEHNDWSPLRPM